MRPCLKICTFFFCCCWFFFYLFYLSLSNFFHQATVIVSVAINNLLPHDIYLINKRFVLEGKTEKKLLNILLGIQHESEIRALFPDTPTDSTDSVATAITLHLPGFVR